jgi:hypothetical protein
MSYAGSYVLRNTTKPAVNGTLRNKPFLQLKTSTVQRMKISVHVENGICLQRNESLSLVVPF